MAVVHQVGPRKWRWRRKDFYRLSELGFFDGQRVELIEGVIYQMPAQKNLHCMGISLTEDALRVAFGPGHWIRVQMSLDLSPLSVPDPDVAVVPGTIRSYQGQNNPVTALLIVEVSETTLPFDRTRKMSLYARSGIEDYWILNLIHRQLEVHRDPAPDTAQPHGYGYATRHILGPTDTVSPLAVPDVSIAVADLLP
ncbi:MAG: Uma2 family endonuclease [Gemmataceae bacterium]|nr:Uma2 family endonuclease [Gemmataceae bacterium]